MAMLQQQPGAFAMLAGMGAQGPSDVLPSVTPMLDSLNGGGAARSSQAAHQSDRWAEITERLHQISSAPAAGPSSPNGAADAQQQQQASPQQQQYQYQAGVGSLPAGPQQGEAAELGGYGAAAELLQSQMPPPHHQQLPRSRHMSPAREDSAEERRKQLPPKLNKEVWAAHPPLSSDLPTTPHRSAPPDPPLVPRPPVP